jgi:hypothetical protein
MSLENEGELVRFSIYLKTEAEPVSTSFNPGNGKYPKKILPQ